jgi:hypothetical protein
VSVWLILPSARPVEEAQACLNKWANKGYRVGVFREEERGRLRCDLWMSGQYPGYAMAVNRLASAVLKVDRNAHWLVAAGDDTDPDERKPEEISEQCSSHFCRVVDSDSIPGGIYEFTFGVMQPTGDRWNCSPSLGDIPTIERVAGSPWLGREWCRRAYGGRGPLWPEYTHCFADEELQLVAQGLGVFWQRPDLTHMHHNWARAPAETRVMPEFLREANSVQHWQKYSKLFHERKAAGFPGSEPLP